jgi:hypothetical protein
VIYIFFDRLASKMSGARTSDEGPEPVPAD